MLSVSANHTVPQLTPLVIVVHDAAFVHNFHANLVETVLLVNVLGSGVGVGGGLGALLYADRDRKVGRRVEH